MRIEEVDRKRSFKRFVFFPEDLYRNDPLWAPPLWADEFRAYYKKKNPVLSHSDYTLFLALEGGNVLGRILIYVDHNFNRFYKSKIGFFGAFECIEDFKVAAGLFDKGEKWLRAKGMTHIRGPIHPVAENWGFLYEGFKLSPVFMTPYNPPYYNTFITKLEYTKIKDLLAYDADAKENYQIPERFSRFKEMLLARKPNLTVRRLDLKNLMKDAEHIWRISNIALQNNWGYVPIDRNEMKDLIKKLKTIVDVDAIWFVEDSGTPVGWALGFPDLNVILKKIRGRLLPFGFLILLTGIKKVRDYRLWGLAVLPEYHNLGLDVLLYMSLFNALSPKGVHLEANYILEDNAGIRNALEKMNLRHTKTYRVYEKSLS